MRWRPRLCTLEYPFEQIRSCCSLQALKESFRRIVGAMFEAITSGRNDLVQAWLIYWQRGGVPSGYACIIEVNDRDLYVCSIGCNCRGRT